MKAFNFKNTIIINILSMLFWSTCLVVLITVAWNYPASSSIPTTLFIIYLLPPILCRLIVAIFGKPQTLNSFQSKGYYVWWATVQLQIFYLRFPVFEEVLRMIPGAYSNWLRLWGSKIGRYVYWGPQIKIMDRGAIIVGDHVIVGYGAGFTSHHFNYSKSGELELLFEAPIVESYAILGGLSGLTPGSKVCSNELLPSTMGLAPFYVWKGGRRVSSRSKIEPSAVALSNNFTTRDHLDAF